MLSIKKLEEYGCDVQSGLERCMNSEEFYLKMVRMLKEEGNFEVLREALNDNDLDRAFEAAHALKGVTGNLALTPLYEPICEITELLRDRTVMDYHDYLEKITEAKNRLDEMIGEEQ